MVAQYVLCKTPTSRQRPPAPPPPVPHPRSLTAPSRCPPGPSPAARTGAWRRAAAQRPSGGNWPLRRPVAPPVTCRGQPIVHTPSLRSAGGFKSRRGHAPLRHAARGSRESSGTRAAVYGAAGGGSGRSRRGLRGLPGTAAPLPPGPLRGSRAPPLPRSSGGWPCPAPAPSVSPGASPRGDPRVVPQHPPLRYRAPSFSSAQPPVSALPIPSGAQAPSPGLPSVLPPAPSTSLPRSHPRGSSTVLSLTGPSAAFLCGLPAPSPPPFIATSAPSSRPPCSLHPG